MGSQNKEHESNFIQNTFAQEGHLMIESQITDVISSRRQLDAKNTNIESQQRFLKISNLIPESALQVNPKDTNRIDS